MLNDRDKKYLSGISANIYLLSIATLVTVTLIFAIGCIYNLYLASIIGSVEGYAISDVAELWASGVELNESYSGIYVMAIRKFELAFLNLGAVIILIIGLWGVHASHKRNKRIVQTLQKCGGW